MIVIHYPSAFKALDTFIDLFNQKTEKVTERMRVGTILTARELVRIYGVSLLKTTSITAIDPTQLPSLQTNNQQLAKLVKCSARSIQRYILKLQKAGFIVRKKFRGSNANFELWLNPQIIFVGKRISVDKAKQDLAEAIQNAKQKEANTTISSSKSPSCPDTYTGNIYNNLLKGVEIVDKSDNAEKIREHLWDTRKIAEVDPSTGAEKSSGRAGGAGARKIASRAEQSDDPHQDLADPARDNFHRFYVDLFWMMARNLLYKNAHLTDSQIVIAKNLIQKLYEPVSKDKIDAVHKIYIERISLVSKFLAKSPNRFVTLPYIYFDTKNQHGFVGTKEWYKKHIKRKKEISLELALSRAISKYTKNEKRPPVLRNPPLKVFRECENMLGKLGDPSLVNRFHAAVLEHNCYTQIN